MKRLTTLLALLLLPNLATGQIPVPAEVPLVNQYIADTFEQRSDAWWKALESQLLLMLDRPVDRVNEIVLRNIIFFGHSHSDKLDLRAASPKLLEIYKHCQDTGYRMLALSALHAVGGEEQLREAFRIARAEDSERIFKMTRAALADLYRQAR